MKRRVFLILGCASLLPCAAHAAALADQINVLTNQARREAGLRPFTASPTLTSLAESYAQTLLQTGKLTHNAGGTTLASRLKSIRYGYRLAAENIAFQSRNDPTNLAGLFLQSWLASEGHRRNILNPDLTQTGCGTATSGQTTYAVQVFATPA